jgi:hypothetical protein
MRADLLRLPGTTAPDPQDIVDLTLITQAIKKTMPEENRIWNQLPELYREGLKKGFSLGLRFAMDFEEETERRRNGLLTEDERRTAQEAWLSDIFNSVLG